MKFHPTLFTVQIAGHDYKFAALTQRDMEAFVEREKTALEAKDNDGLKAAHREVVVAALVRGGNEVTAEDLAEIDVPAFAALLHAIMQAHGMKLEAKLGEAKASQ